MKDSYIKVPWKVDAESTIYHVHVSKTYPMLYQNMRKIKFDHNLDQEFDKGWLKTKGGIRKVSVIFNILNNSTKLDDESILLTLSIKAKPIQSYFKSLGIICLTIF